MQEVLNANGALRSRLWALFASHVRTDLSIDSFFDSNMGRMFVDDLMNPSMARLITSQTTTFGGFVRFAGNAYTKSARDAMANLRTQTFLMPSPNEWMALAHEIHGDKLHKRERLSFTADSVQTCFLETLSRKTPENVQLF